MSYRFVYASQAKKDAKKLKGSHLAEKVKQLLALIEVNPFVEPPPFEALVGDLHGAFSRRINIHHRLVYQVIKQEQVIKVLRLWTHYH